MGKLKIMKRETYRKKAIEALVRLRAILEVSGPGDTYTQEAITINPWYSLYYIQERLHNLLEWLEEPVLWSWTNSYPLNSDPPRNVGLITAGNLPLVGFHDLLAILLSGHRVQLIPSRRDAILMKRVCELLWEIDPELRSVIHLVSQFSSIDYLIASGGNQAGKSLQHTYQHIPQTIRKHRFSVAVLDSHTSEEALERLMDDIFLFNGQGCRNVSNIILPESQISPLIKRLKSYPIDRLTSPYLQKLSWERSKNTTLGKPFLEGGNILLLPSSTLHSTEIATIRIVPSGKNSTREEMVQKNFHHLQCVVNKGTEFGKSQYPAITAFEDNIDLLKILTRI